jgi:hypothetical protein
VAKLLRKPMRHEHPFLLPDTDSADLAPSGKPARGEPFCPAHGAVDG